MFCDKCGQPTEGKIKDPWCMYKFENGQVINQLFHPDQIPDGWHDSPGAATVAVKEEDVQSEPDLSKKKPPKANSKGLNV